MGFISQNPLLIASLICNGVLLLLLCISLRLLFRSGYEFSYMPKLVALDAGEQQWVSLLGYVLNNIPLDARGSNPFAIYLNNMDSRTRISTDSIPPDPIIDQVNPDVLLAYLKQMFSENIKVVSREYFNAANHAFRARFDLLDDGGIKIGISPSSVPHSP